MPAGSDRRLRDALPSAGGEGRPSVCIVSSEIVGPSGSGGIGTSMTGLAEHLATIGCSVTILYTGGILAPDIRLHRWTARYADRGIEVVAIAIEEMRSLAGPVRDHGFGTPYLVYRYLAARRFDVVHFNDYRGEGSLCLAARKLGVAFGDTLLLVALHGPSQWALELNQARPITLVQSAHDYAERLSVKCADVLWSPSQYLLDWARRHGFELPSQSFVQQYCLRSPPTSAHHGRTGPVKDIVFFGRLEARKGLPLFCDAVHQLRDTLADRHVSVTFLGKPGVCDGMDGLAYVAQRSTAWRFAVKAVTNLGQPEALAYLGSGGKLAVMASPADNSPCTVYEALAWGIPFVAARVGGVPELVHEADHDRVLFECTTDALCVSLLGALDAGGWAAAPAEPPEEIRRVWSAFHASARRFLPPRRTPETSGRVVAIVEGGSPVDLNLTRASLTRAGVEHVIVVNRRGSVEEARALDAELAALSDECVLLIHAGVKVRPQAFARMLSALQGSDIDGLQPAAEVISARGRRLVPPLGGDPAFTLFEGATFTGGLLVRGAAFTRARQGRAIAPEGAFVALADSCVTRGLQIWPYPDPVFERSAHWRVGPAPPLEARLQAMGQGSEADRLLMVGAMHFAGTDRRPRRGRMALALKLVDLGLAPVVRAAAWVRRRLGLRRPLSRRGRARR